MTTHRCDLTIRLKTDIYLPNLVETLSSQNINKAVDLFPKTRDLHRENRFKPYCIGPLRSIEKDKIYKKGKQYRLSITSFDLQVLMDIFMALMAHEKRDFDVVSSDMKRFEPRFVEILESKTPAVMSLPNKVDGKVRYWDITDGDIMQLQKQIRDNLEKKYQQFFGKEIKAPEDFISMFEILNQKPIFVNYKGGKIIGNKFRLGINSDENSQRLAKLALAVGILEKNSLGCGYSEMGR